MASFSDVPRCVDYMRAAGQDLTRNVALFLSTGEEENAIVRQPVDTARDARFRRYMVNVMVSNGGGSSAGAPVVEELNPIHGNLIGRIEHIAQMGTLVTDFLLIKPGRAASRQRRLPAPRCAQAAALPLRLGGLEARHQGPRDQHRAAGRGGRLQSGVHANARSRADPARRARGAWLGDRELYYMLAAYDPDFPGLFKVQADFDDTIARSSKTTMPMPG
jgi:hypothetical protein